MPDKPYKKVSELTTFKINVHIKNFYQKWDDTQKKYINSDSWMQGFSPRFLFELDDCLCHFSADQLGQMLVAAFDGIDSHIGGKTFSVRTNGKTGKEIKYWINLVRDPQTAPRPVAPSQPVYGQDPPDDQVRGNTIPF